MKLFNLVGIAATLSSLVCMADSPLKMQAEQAGVLQYKGKWYQVGDTIFGYKNYVYVVVGDLQSPLILGVPHDGIGLGDPEIPESGKTGRDLSTHPLSNAVAALFEADTKLKPWIMVNTIHRKRMDPNTYPRDVDKRYTDPEAKATYESYHELLALARKTIAQTQKGGKGGLFLDMHGHAHKYANGNEAPYTSITNGNELYSHFIHQSEIGYGLSNFSLEQEDTYLDGIADSSTIAYLAKAHPDVPFSQIIRGPKSFGGLLQAEGLSAVPSPAIPILDRNQELFGGSSTQPRRRPYFNGGYCTRAYGTSLLGTSPGFDDNIIAMQIETPGINVRNNARIRERSSHQLKRALILYLNTWFGYDFPNSPYPY